MWQQPRKSVRMERRLEAGRITGEYEVKVRYFDDEVVVEMKEEVTSIGGEGEREGRKDDERIKGA